MINVEERRTIVRVARTALAAALLCGTYVLGALQSGQTASLAPGAASAVPAGEPVATQRWQEDSLPPELYLWTDVNRGDLVGPGRANWLAAAAYQGDPWHVGCWASVADTTLVMCPDGLIAYS